MLAMTINDSDSLGRLRELVGAVCVEHGVDLVDARFTTDGGRVLRVLIEQPGADPAAGAGVTLSECSAVSRALSPVLDAHEDALPGGAYRLEVGSPGLERPLFGLADYERFAGREAKLQTHAPIDGRRRFTGILRGVDGTDVRFEQDGAPIVIPHGQIDKAHLVYRF